jgi:membrane protein YdbS with pleckstrin-like domain
MVTGRMPRRTLMPVTSHPATGLPPAEQSAGEPAPAALDVGAGAPACGHRSDSAAVAPTSTGAAPTDPADAGSASAAAVIGPADARSGPSGLAGDLPLERHRLNPRVKRYWRWRAFFTAIPSLVLLVGLAIVIPWGPPWLRWGIVGIAAICVVVGMVVLPPIRYRVFWYAISETEIDIQHKIIFIERSIIPMHRVQSLQTERGPLADHYRMTNLKIKTAAGSVSISGLDRDEANVLCDRISKLSDIADDV